jgi:hypothetical protein
VWYCQLPSIHAVLCSTRSGNFEAVRLQRHIHRIFLEALHLRKREDKLKTCKRDCPGQLSCRSRFLVWKLKMVRFPKLIDFLPLFFYSKTHVVRHFGGSPPRVMFSPGGIFHHFPGVNFATIWLENWFIPWVWIEGLEYGFWYFWRCLDFVAQRGQKFWFCDHNFWEKYSIYLVLRNIISI